MSMKTLACIAVLAATPAYGENALQALVGAKLCQTIKEDTLRLKCFDGLFAAKPDASNESAATKEPPTWEINETKSPLDDSPEISATLKADDNIGLILRCKEKKTEAIFGGLFTFLGSNESIKMFVRIGDGKLMETSWHPSSNGRGAFAPNATQFIQALPQNGKLFLRARSYSGENIDGEFTLGEVAAVRDKIAVACNWNKAAKTGGAAR
jgi:hypothetical protein